MKISLEEEEVEREEEDEKVSTMIEGKKLFIKWKAFFSLVMQL